MGIRDGSRREREISTYDLPRTSLLSSVPRSAHGTARVTNFNVRASLSRGRRLKKKEKKKTNTQRLFAKKKKINIEPLRKSAIVKINSRGV